MVLPSTSKRPKSRKFNVRRHGSLCLGLVGWLWLLLVRQRGTATTRTEADPPFHPLLRQPTTLLTFPRIHDDDGPTLLKESSRRSQNQPQQAPLDLLSNGTRFFYDEPYTGPVRAFIWKGPFPCEMGPIGTKRTPLHRGFIYIKEFKTASSTLAGITLRMSRNQARKKMSPQKWQKYQHTLTCQSRFVHVLRARPMLENRIRTASFAWTVVREPTARLVSKFFHFGVSRKEWNSTDIADYYRHPTQQAHDKHYYLQSLSVRRNFSPQDDFQECVEEILEDYDFIGISERLEESLVVLQLLLGLDTGDLLYLNAKQSGTYEWWPLHQTCVHLQPPVVTPTMVEYFQTNEWKDYVRGDVLLYRAANASLDRTINMLGRARVERHVQRLEWAQRYVTKKCRPTVACFAKNGTRNVQQDEDCLWMDAGCGYKCLDQVADELPTIREFAAL